MDETDICLSALVRHPDCRHDTCHGMEGHLRDFVKHLLAQKDVPLEIADMVSFELDVKDIVRISALSPRLHALERAVIYHDVTIDIPSAGYAKLLTQPLILLRTLLTDHTAAANIQRFRLVGNTLSEYRGLRFDRSSFKKAVDSDETRVPEGPLLYLDYFSAQEVQLCARKVGCSRRRRQANVRPAMWNDRRTIGNHLPA